MNDYDAPDHAELAAECSKPIRYHAGVFNHVLDTQEKVYREMVRTQSANVEDIPITSLMKNMHHFALGMASESGEVAGDVLKHWVYQRELNVSKVLSECGDVLFYLTGLLDTLGYSIEDAMNANTQKIKARYPNGFNPHDAQQRRDEKEREEVDFFAMVKGCFEGKKYISLDGVHTFSSNYRGVVCIEDVPIQLNGEWTKQKFVEVKE